MEQPDGLNHHRAHFYFVEGDGKTPLFWAGREKESVTRQCVVTMDLRGLQLLRYVFL